MKLSNIFTLNAPTLNDKESQRYIQQYRDVCAICLEEFRYGDVVKILPCKHVFHVDCLDPWCLNQSPVCPTCKRFLTKDGVCPFSSDYISHEMIHALSKGEMCRMMCSLAETDI